MFWPRTFGGIQNVRNAKTFQKGNVFCRRLISNQNSWMNFVCVTAPIRS
jgi:hypothetical protein